MVTFFLRKEGRMTGDEEKPSKITDPRFLPVPRTPRAIAKELRDMASAATNEYRSFAYMKPSIKSILSTAADMLENGA